MSMVNVAPHGCYHLGVDVNIYMSDKKDDISLEFDSKWQLCNNYDEHLLSRFTQSSFIP